MKSLHRKITLYICLYLSSFNRFKRYILYIELTINKRRPQPSGSGFKPQYICPAFGPLYRDAFLELFIQQSVLAILNTLVKNLSPSLPSERNIYEISQKRIVSKKQKVTPNMIASLPQVKIFENNISTCYSKQLFSQRLHYDCQLLK